MANDRDSPRVKRKFSEALTAVEKAVVRHAEALDQIQLLRFKPGADKDLTDAGLRLMAAQSLAVGTEAAVQQAKLAARGLNWVLDKKKHEFDGIEFDDPDSRFVLAT